MLSAILGGLAEAAFPQRCGGCDLPGHAVCESCLERLVRVDRRRACPRCGAPRHGERCAECTGRPFRFEAARCVGPLEPPLSRMLTLLKDGGDRRLAAPLGGWLAKAAEDWAGWDCTLTWVPATHQAILRRGFDHAHLLAVEVASVFGRPVRRLFAAGSRRDQRELGRAARETNLAKAFSTTSQCVPARILLVDDVLTTCSTADAATRVLMEAGAEEVRVLAAARVCGGGRGT